MYFCPGGAARTGAPPAPAPGGPVACILPGVCPLRSGVWVAGVSSVGRDSHTSATCLGTPTSESGVGTTEVGGRFDVHIKPLSE